MTDIQPLTVEEEARAQARYFKQGAHLIPSDLWYESGAIWGIRFGENRCSGGTEEWARKAQLLLNQNAELLMENHDLRKALENLLNNPVVSGMKSRIRNYAREHKTGGDDPVKEAQEVLMKV